VAAAAPLARSTKGGRMAQDVELTRDWTVPPGETLREALAEREMSQRYLAFATGYSQKHVNQLVNGRMRITVDAAIRLERELDISARFWLHLQADHDLWVARHNGDAGSDGSMPVPSQVSQPSQLPNSSRPRTPAPRQTGHGRGV
jgi:addiction module HigA family antidote